MAGKPRLPAMSPTSIEPGPSHTDISMDISMENNRGGGGGGAGGKCTNNCFIS